MFWAVFLATLASAAAARSRRSYRWLAEDNVFQKVDKLARSILSALSSGVSVGSSVAFWSSFVGAVSTPSA